MNWKLKLLILIILSVPAFTGYPVVSFEAEILPDITYGWVVYLLVVNVFIWIITGRQFFPNVVTIAVLIAMPVVFVGAGISYLMFLSGLGYASGAADYSAHYVSLCITMLTVIPLALSMVAIIPFQDFEQNMLSMKTGVYDVIVDLRSESSTYKKWVDSSLSASASGSRRSRLQLIRRRLTGLFREMIQIGVEGICASIQYIPLWAVEIAQLPRRTKGN